MISMDDQEDLTSPLLVVASVGKSEFRPERRDTYTYEIEYALNR